MLAPRCYGAWKLVVANSRPAAVLRAGIFMTPPLLAPRSSSWMFRGEEMSERTGWSREFDDPIALPGGQKLVTLRDAELTY